MAHYEARMSSKGQITIPAEVRAEFRLKEGDIVDFYVDPLDRRIQIIARNGKLLELRGIASMPGAAPLSLDEIDEGIGAYLTEKHERISREWNERQEFEAWKRRRDRKVAG
ncbi:MAG: AbrB/MazE/SpoVT family DNA-binding domain-containing protein [Bauldia sp.]|nr:AbrB/MazE/SpoVT family DNA-binding domain-containing protein [Bauldia sp.]